MAVLPTLGAVQAWDHLYKATQVFTEMIESDLKQAGLPPLSWYDVLLEIHNAPDGKLRQYEIGERTQLTKHSLSRLLDRLQGQNYIHRQPCEADKRGSFAVITNEGSLLLKKMWAIYGKAINSYFAKHYSREELGEIELLMSRIPG